MSGKLGDKINIKSSNINLLRFLCAIAVIISHSHAITLGQDDFVSKYTDGQCGLGKIAVSVFFFLSGLYVAKSLEKTKSINTFLKKRCIRIFPQLWIVVGSTIIIGIFLTTRSIYEYLICPKTYMYLLNAILIPVHNLPGVFENLPYSTVNGALWTMPVEFVCYIGLALIALLSNNKKVKNIKIKIEIFGFVVLFIFSIILQLRGTSNVLFSAIDPMVIFFEGVLFYEYRNNIKLNVFIAILLLIILVLLGKTPFFNIGLILILPYIIIGIALGLPQIKWNCRLFMISYEMYLIGWPIQQIIRMNINDISPFENWLFTLPIDICLAWLLYVMTDRVIKKCK